MGNRVAFRQHSLEVGVSDFTKDTEDFPTCTFRYPGNKNVCGKPAVMRAVPSPRHPGLQSMSQWSTPSEHFYCWECFQFWDKISGHNPLWDDYVIECSETCQLARGHEGECLNLDC